MKITKTIEIDSRGIEKGDVFYKFPNYNDSDPKSFYSPIKRIVKDIKFQPRGEDLQIHWDEPTQNGTLPESHDIFPFTFFSEGDINGIPGNIGFNPYVLDIDERVEKEIEKRKNYVKEKLRKSIIACEQSIINIKIILESIL